MNLGKLKSLFADYGCKKIYVKTLSANDNSKNQVYLGGNFDVLNILPIRGISNEPAGDWKKERFKAALNFSWISDIGEIKPAQYAQLILYPKYPEVRFSGFLLGCKQAPSKLMTERLEGRLLFLSVTEDGQVLGYVSAPDSELTKEFNEAKTNDEHGVFKILFLPKLSDNKERLLRELSRIHKLGWIDSKRLDRNHNILPCKASNCGGYTLEAELGVTPNGFSEPDYLGWEIKQFGVQDFTRLVSSRVTLMTPEPTHGIYSEQGVEFFMRKYGYDDVSGIQDRINFGGIHRCGEVHPRTRLKLSLLGYDSDKGKIRDSSGKIALVDSSGKEAAAWSFKSLLLHWNRKHNLACYIPSLKSKKNDNLKYYYGNTVILGMGTDFHLFLREMSQGNIYYDPGIKMEHSSTRPRIKQRSQFRIQSLNIENLYFKSELKTLSWQ